MDIETLIKILQSARIPYSTEVEMQNAIEELLKEKTIPYFREYSLSKRDRVDFMVGGIAIECKVRGQPMAVYKQIERYTEHEEVEAVVVFTGRHMGLREHINGKPIYIISAGAAWL